MNIARRGASLITGFCLLLLFGGSDLRASDWPLWEQYKDRFLTRDGRIVDWSANEQTTSEGEAYALFFALVANDRPAFDSILNWTSQHMAQGGLRQNLPSWLWKRDSSGEWAVTDANSASDADLWMAYTLIQAGRLWHADEYRAVGRSLALRISREEIVALPENRYYLLPGRRGFQRSPQNFFCNPSYAPMQIVTAFASEFPGGPWREMAGSVSSLIAPEIGHGFAMDWVQFRADSGFSPWTGPLPAGTPSGSYDAIRVYLWAGMLHPRAPGRERLLASLFGMKSYLATHGIPPERVGADGLVLDSNTQAPCCQIEPSKPGPVGFSAAVIPFLLAVGATDAANAQADRVKRARVSSTGLYGAEQRYYDQNLVLFSQGWSQGLYHFDIAGQLKLRWKAS